MEKLNYWQQRKYETLDLLAKVGYENTNEMLEQFISSNFQVIDLLANKLLELTVKYGDTVELVNSLEFKELSYQVNVAINQLANQERVWLKELLEFQVGNIMGNTSAELGFNFNLQRAELEKLINTDWVGDGKNWSYRVWGNKVSLIEALNTTVREGVIRGWSVDTLVRELSKKLTDVSRSRLVALARTEMMHFLNEAQRLTYAEAGVQHIEVMVAEDERTCEHCMDREGMILPVGSTDIPPYHPRCRCTIVPHMETFKKPE